MYIYKLEDAIEEKSWSSIVIRLSHWQRASESNYLFTYPTIYSLFTTKAFIPAFY